MAVSSVDPDTVARRVGWTKGSAWYRRALRFSHMLIRAPSDSIARTYDATYLALEEAAKNHDHVFEKLKRIRSSRDFDARRDVYSQLGDTAYELLRCYAQAGDSHQIEKLRPFIRPYWEEYGNWQHAASCGKKIYLPAAEEVKPLEIPWIQSRDVAWFALLTDERALAEKTAQSALDAFRRRQDSEAPYGRAYCHRVLGLLKRYDPYPPGEHEQSCREAIKEFELGLNEVQMNGNIGHVSNYLKLNITSAAMTIGDMSRAEILLRQVGQEAFEKRDVRIIAKYLLHAGEYFYRQNKFESAERFLNHARIASLGNLRYDYGKACALLSLVYGATKHDERAYIAATEAEQSFRKLSASRSFQRAQARREALRSRLPENARFLIDETLRCSPSQWALFDDALSATKTAGGLPVVTGPLDVS